MSTQCSATSFEVLRVPIEYLMEVGEGINAVPLVVKGMVYISCVKP